MELVIYNEAIIEIESALEERYKKEGMNKIEIIQIDSFAKEALEMKKDLYLCERPDLFEEPLEKNSDKNLQLF